MVQSASKGYAQKGVEACSGRWTKEVNKDQIREDSVHYVKTCGLIFWEKAGQLSAKHLEAGWLGFLVPLFTNYRHYELFTFFQLQFLPLQYKNTHLAALFREANVKLPWYHLLKMRTHGVSEVDDCHHYWGEHCGRERERQREDRVSGFAKSKARKPVKP